MMVLWIVKYICTNMRCIIAVDPLVIIISKLHVHVPLANFKPHGTCTMHSNTEATEHHEHTVKIYDDIMDSQIYMY